MERILLHKGSHHMEMLTKGTERFNIVLQQYPLKFTLANSRMKKYFWMADCNPDFTNLPKKHQQGLKQATLEWKLKERSKKKELCLYDTVTKDWVVKNSKVAGTPNIKPINGQDFWSGGDGQQWHRGKLKEFLYDYYASKVRLQLPEKIFPPKDHYMQFEYIFYFPFKLYNANEVQDIDNHGYPYAKAFKDVLQTLEVISGDDYRYVRGDYMHYVEVASEEERRLEVKIHFCQNEDIPVPKIFLNNNPVINSYSVEDDPL